MSLTTILQESIERTLLAATDRVLSKAEKDKLTAWCSAQKWASAPIILHAAFLQSLEHLGGAMRFDDPAEMGIMSVMSILEEEADVWPVCDDDFSDWYFTHLRLTGEFRPATTDTEGLRVAYFEWVGEQWEECLDFYREFSRS